MILEFSPMLQALYLFFLFWHQENHYTLKRLGMFLMEKEILYVQNPYQYLTRYFSDIPVDKELKKTH